MSKYRVHSRQETYKEVPAKMDDGTPVLGRLPILLVELVALDGGRSLTIEEAMLTEDARAAALEKFAGGAVIETAFVQVEPPPPTEPAPAPTP